MDRQGQHGESIFSGYDPQRIRAGPAVAWPAGDTGGEALAEVIQLQVQVAHVAYGAVATDNALCVT